MATAFQILGPLRVTTAENREIDLGGAKPAALLALLLLRPNELVASDRLIEDLWDGQPPATAAKTLQVHVSRLRRALADGQNGAGGVAIVTRGSGYALEVAPDAIDAVRFEGLVTEGTAALAAGEFPRASARLRAALALWRGDALADFTYASFAQDEIARLDGLRNVAVESAVEAELALGRHTELIPELKSLVKRHPLSEHLRGQLMLALYRAGHQAEALGVYRTGRRMLVEGLGIEPSEELRELERAILAQDPKLAVSETPAPQSRGAGGELPSRGAFVGYERELIALENALEQALLGRGGIGLVGGEPGVGKTRLVDELAAVAQARGGRVLVGRGWSGRGAPAYWPWIQVLRGLVAEREAAAIRAELGPSLSQLAQLAPELADLAPGAKAAEAAAPEDARFGLFDAFGTALRRAAASNPIVIVLDDIHAADPSSLELLRFLAQATSDAALLIVATYRDTESESVPDLTETLSELSRASDCLQLVLSGLDEADTAHLVEVSAQVEPMPRLAAAIHDVSAGNPLFVSELVRLLGAEDRLHELREDDELVLPRGVNQVIERRVARLPADSRATATVAAVVGREFDAELVARACGTATADVLDRLESATAARIVEPLGGKRFRFAHDLIRQALYAAMSPGERMRLHAAVASALEDMHAHPSGAVVTQLAHHLSEALPVGDPAKAVQYLTLAADQAQQVSAYGEASTLYSRGAEIGAMNGVDSAVLCELNLRLAETYVVPGALREARAAVERAVALAAKLPPDPARDARLAVMRAHAALADADTQPVDAVLDATRVLEQLGDYAGAARGWEAVCESYAPRAFRGRRSQRLQQEEAAQRMLACAERAGSAALAGRAMLFFSASLTYGKTPIPEAIARIHALIARAPDVTIRARLMWGVTELQAMSGQFEDARRTLAESFALLPHGERTRYRGSWLAWAGRVEMWAGNTLRVEDLVREEGDLHRQEGLLAYLASEQTLLVDALVAQRRLEEANVLLEELVPYAAPDDLDAHLRQARSRARLELARGDLAAAEAAARASLEHLADAEVPDDEAETLLVLAQILRAAGRAEEAVDAAHEALRLSQERKHVVLEQRAREFLSARHVVALRRV